MSLLKRQQQLQRMQQAHKEAMPVAAITDAPSIVEVLSKCFRIFGANEYDDGVTPRVTSISDIRYYKQCKQLWNFASPLRMNLRPNRSPHYFLFGRAFHTAMEAYYTLEDAVSAFEEHMIEEAQNEGIPRDDENLNEAIDFGMELVREYILWAETPGKGFGFDYEVISTEEPHTIHLFDNVHYGFRTDMLIRNVTTNQLWLVDFKTAAAMPTERALDYLSTDEQATAYLCATEQIYGCNLSGIIFVFACTKRFQEPRILKNGNLSTNISQYTTHRLYTQALSRLELSSTEKYGKILTELRNKVFFNPVKLIKSQTEKDWFWNENLMPVVREMSGKPFIYPNPSRMNCGTCSYVGPCIASNDPRLDETSELDLSYVKGEPRYQPTESESVT